MKIQSLNKFNIFQTYSFKMFVIFSAISISSILLIAYLIFSEVSATLIDQEKNLNGQIVARTSAYMDNKIESAKKIIQDIYYSDDEMEEIINFMLNESSEGWDEDILLMMNLRQRFDNLFISALYNDSDIVDIILVSTNGQKSVVFSKEWSTVNVETTPFVYPWATEISSGLQSLTIIPSYDSLHTNKGSKKIYSMATSLFSTQTNSIVIGTIIINFETGKVEQAYESYEEDIKGDIKVFDKYGSIIYDSSGENYDQAYESFEDILTIQNDFDDQDYFISKALTKNNDFLVATLVPKDKLYESVTSLRAKVTMVLVAVFVVLLLAYYYTSRFLVKRINHITEAIGRVQEGDLSARIQIGSHQKDELHSIALMFNSMCEELDAYINRTYLFELKLKETELIALQSQINPHFIYNTLEIIRVKAIMNNNHDVGNMINLLSNLFRRSLRSDDIVVSIKEELDYCKDYLELNQIRFLDRMKVHYKIDVDLYENGTLKGILQPLVENIMIHSVNNSSKMVDIIIEGFLEGQDIVIKICDTGMGIEVDRLREINSYIKNSSIGISTQHIGLKNVNDRLKLVFGDDYGLHISSVVNEQTVITIRFPRMDVEAMIDLTTGNK